ncbi:hypothetical protein RN001_008149 [Aquatica leii]|uniref:Aminopeptidase n=1 Tax=Aquatica leii TaxID=1421715 RepID=A0AAN7SP55_9COLE|nr:hypothetical protein RN001_008149 [Aquatica leii]
MMRILVILCFSAITLAELSPYGEKTDINSLRLMERLPNNIIPIWYNITLEPNFTLSIFTGSVSIKLKIVNETQEIVLHAYKLEDIDKEDITINCNNNVNNTITKVSTNNKTEFLTIKLSKTITANETCVLNFRHFQGNLSDQFRVGVYLSKYNEEGSEKLLATTQLQKTHARKVFPCFDEPHFKARFLVNLIRNKNYTSISNEELENSIPLDSQRVLDVYKATKLMSTYLLAFIVTEYASTEVKQGQRVFADRPAIKNGEANFALEMGIEILSALEEYTKHRYALNKIDQIGIPDTYLLLGAMENWGLVTYRKGLIIYPYGYQVTKNIQFTVEIISHEYAHQWFGNLVTCSWWTHLWLNEGFASYFQHFLPAMIGWDIADIFVTDSVHMALSEDSRNTTTAMSDEDASDIIVYQKASSIIRMLNHIVTEDVFRKSIILYLNANQYKSTTPAELYQAFDATIKQENKTTLLGKHTISEIMNSWDSQAGYPILNVDKTNNKITVQQNRFFTDGSKDDTKWIIPLTYVLENSTHNFSTTTANEWMANPTLVLDHQLNGWVIFNKQQMGFYRVKYNEENWNLLVNQLNKKDHTEIHVINRAQLIDDAFTFVQINQMNYSQVLELSKYLAKEVDYIPRTTFLKHIAVIDTKLAQENGRKNYKIFMNSLFNGSLLNTITMEEQPDDSLKTKYLRIDLINWLCKLGNQKCTNYALGIFQNNSTVSPDLQTPIYCGAMRIGNQNDWDSLFGKLKKETNALSRSRIINALGCSENSEILSKYITTLLDKNNTINVLTAFRSIVNAGDFGVEFLFNYTYTNFADIKDMKNVKTIITDIASKLNTKTHEEMLRNLSQKHPELNSTFNNALKIVRANIDWNEKYSTDIKTWFSQYEPNTNGSAMIPNVFLNYFK